MTEILRPYQLRAMHDLREAFRRGRKRVGLYSPTGSGKTEIAIAMARLALERGRDVRFLAHRVELVGQAARRFEKSGIEAGIIQGKNTRDMDRAMLIGSIHTVAKRGMPASGLLIIDEFHAVAGSEAYQRLLAENPDVPVVGLSATPFSRGLGKHFQELIVASTIANLIRDGYLVDVDIYGPSEPDLRGVKIVAGEYHEGQLGEAVNKPKLVGDIVGHWHRLANHTPTVVFATNIAHSKHIVEQFQASGVTAEHIDAYTSDVMRAEVLARFDSGETEIVSNVAVLAEGWDCPACETMVLARPTRSLTRYIQMAGRVLRPAPGKTKALMLDHSGTVRRLGFPTDDLPLELDDGTHVKRDVKENVPLPVQCPQCTYVMPPRSPTCPACGWKPERQNQVAHQHGDLAPMKRRTKKIDGADKAKVFSELKGYASQKGHKPGWAFHKYVELFGVRPHTHFDKIMASVPTPATLNLIKHLNIRHAKARA